MRLISSLFFVFVIIYHCTISQSILPQGIEFTTQSHIDSFQILYPGCTKVAGNVRINGAGIYNVDSLYSITSIDSTLTINNNPELISLEGLSNIVSIGKDLVIGYNQSLTSLDGLDNLSYVGRDVSFISNGLKNFEGIGSIKKVNRNLWIMDHDSILDLYGLGLIDDIGYELVILYNDNLSSITGLNSLVHAGHIFINNNPLLLDLNGLSSIQLIDGSLTIWFNNSLKSLFSNNSLFEIGGIDIMHCPALYSLDGLDSINHVGGIIELIGNDSLANLFGLASLKSINGNIYISNNNTLTSLIGLDNLNPNSIEDLHIENNASLSTCHVQSICDYLAAPNGKVSIYGNAPGCNSREEVEARCAGGMETGIRIFLQGAYSGNNSMNTNLNSVLPITQPYDTLQWQYQGSEKLNNIPPDIVDWILVELRDSSDYNIVDDTRVGLLFEDGSIKDTNLINDLYFYNVDTGYYYMSVRHRNHISVMTEQAVFFPSQTVIDFTDTSIIKPYGGATQAQIELDPGTWGMICGDINNDGKLQFSGPGNDRMEIIQQITNVSGLTNITAVINGYYFEDLDLNTEVKYSGPKNDASIIIQNIITLTGSTSINSVYTCPLMFLYP